MNAALHDALRRFGIDPSQLAESPYCPGVLETAVPGGAPAVEQWQQLRDEYGETGYWPILRGEVRRTVAPQYVNAPSPPPIDIAAILSQVPKGAVKDVLHEHHAEERDLLNKMLAEQGQKLIEENDGDDYYDEDDTPWPSEPMNFEKRHLTVPFDTVSRKPLKTCGLALVPARQPADVFAHLAFGGWNDCPPPPIQVAVFREWARRYGAVPATISNDTVECVVDRPPATEAEATALANEQFKFCEDIVSQGTESIRQLAINLWRAPYWFFWWD
jgi:hypothetical protein